MALRLLFTIHAVVTLSAGVVLVFAPTAIPQTVGIVLPRSAFLLSYLLAASEFSVSVLSWSARRLTDAKAIRVIVVSIIVLHGSSALLEIRALVDGVNAVLWINIAVRIIAITLFAHFGIRRRP